MKKIILFTLTFFLTFSVFSQNINYMSKEEILILNEMNEARTNPKAYAKKYLKPLYDALKNKNPNQNKDSNALAVFTAYKYLNSIKAMSKLKPELGLTLAARDFIQDPKRVFAHHSNGVFENTMALGLEYAKPMDSYSLGEIAWDNLDKISNCKVVNISVDDVPMEKRIGNTIIRASTTIKSVSFVLGWIIDNGNLATNWGHRRAILNPELKKIGIAFGIGKGKYEGKVALYASLSSNYETKDDVLNNINWKPKKVNWNSSHKHLKCPVNVD